MPNQIRKKGKQTANNEINKLAGAITVPINLKGANINRLIRKAKKRYFKEKGESF